MAMTKGVSTCLSLWGTGLRWRPLRCNRKSADRAGRREGVNTVGVDGEGARAAMTNGEPPHASRQAEADGVRRHFAHEVIANSNSISCG